MIKDRPESRTCRVLSRLMPGVEEEKMEALLAGRRVMVSVGRDAAQDSSGQLVATFTVNLLARLFPVVQDLVIAVPEDGEMQARIPIFGKPALVATLEAIVQAVGGRVRVSFEPNPSTADIMIGIGQVEARAPVAFFVGNRGWIAKISRRGPVAAGQAVNPVGSYAAATFGVAQVWNALLLPHKHLLKGIELFQVNDEFQFSTFDYSQRDDGPNPDLPTVFDIDRLTLAGIGAGGSAWVFTIASLPEVRGFPNLIEHDHVTGSNPQRYVIASERNAIVSAAKVDLAIQCFRGHAGVTAKRIALPYGDATRQLSGEDKRIVVAQVHSRSARLQVQQDTPQVLFDGAASERGEFVVRRVAFGRSACLGCEFSEEDNPEGVSAKQYAKVFGLPVLVFLQKVRDNDTYTEADLAVMGSYRRKGQAADVRLPGVGERHSDWARSLCGVIRISELDEEVPIPHAPVLVGILLAGEVLKEITFPDAVLDSYFQGTVIGRMSPKIGVNRRHPRQGCRICQNELFQRQYERAWRREITA